MEYSEIKKRIKVYQITSILTIFLTLLGFSYNVYRLEQSEINSNIRTSSFEMLKELANLEQIIYAAYYEKDKKEGNPRIAWVKVGLIVDLSKIDLNNNSFNTHKLYESWQKNWKNIHNNQENVDDVILNIDLVRKEIRSVLQKLN